jgi:hypothetical protein
MRRDDQSLEQAGSQVVQILEGIGHDLVKSAGTRNPERRSPIRHGQPCRSIQAGSETGAPHNASRLGDRELYVVLHA